MRGVVRRGPLVIFFLALAVLHSAIPAAAHNGVGAAFKGRAGPYIVYAYDGYTVPNNELVYRLVLLDASSGDPAEDVRVTISASKTGTARIAATASVYANVVFYTLVNPYPANWLVDLRLDSGLGRGEVSFHMHGYPGYISTATAAAPPVVIAQDDGAPVATIVAASCGSVAVAGGAAVFIWRRRRRLRPQSAS